MIYSQICFLRQFEKNRMRCFRNGVNGNKLAINMKLHFVEHLAFIFLKKKPPKFVLLFCLYKHWKLKWKRFKYLKEKIQSEHMSQQFYKYSEWKSPLFCWYCVYDGYVIIISANLCKKLQGAAENYPVCRFLLPVIMSHLRLKIQDFREGEYSLYIY